MKKIFLIARLMLALVLLFFGLNGFFHYFPIPSTTDEAAAFQFALWKSNYLMYMVKAIEVVCGVCLILNRYTTMALLLLMPVSVNILLVDLILQPQYMFMGILVFALNAFLLARRKNVLVLLLE